MLVFPKSIVTFFVNKGNAKFEDMKNLIDYVAKNVLENWN